MTREQELHAKVVDAFVTDWVGKYTGVKPEMVVGLGVIDNPHGWTIVCAKCPIARGHVGSAVGFPVITLLYLFTVSDNEAVPPLQYGVVVGQCPNCGHVYFAKGVIREG